MSNLIRKQYLVSEHNVQKVEQLANAQGTSAADIVRLAIDAYDPDNEIGAPDDLMELVSHALKEAITATKHATKKTHETLDKLSRSPL